MQQAKIIFSVAEERNCEDKPEVVKGSVNWTLFRTYIAQRHFEFILFTVNHHLFLQECLFIKKLKIHGQLCIYPLFQWYKNSQKRMNHVPGLQTFFLC